MTALATFSLPGSAVDGLDARMRLGPSEPLGVGMKRVTMDQLELAASGYFDSEEMFSSAVHESRKAIKRVRSLLRLVRGELPQDVFSYEDKTLRNTARMVGEVRSSVAITEAAQLIRDLYGDLLADGTFEDLIARLSHRRDQMELRALEDPYLVGRVVRNLERAYHRYSSWPTDPEAMEVYGIGISDRYSAVEVGLGATYERGRNEMVTAYKSSTARDFHLWRKRAKYLRHQMEFLVPLWPEVVAGVAVTLDRLGLILGEEHDIAELQELLVERPDMCPNPRERSLLSALATQRRRELQVAAQVLGRRVYAETPESIKHRFGEYWESRHLALHSGLDTIVVY